MPVISIKRIVDTAFRERMSDARAAYLDDRFDESVHISVGVYIDLMSADPSCLEGTRVDPKSRFGRWPDYGITLADAGTTDLHIVDDGRTHSMASAVCYFEYVLEAVVLAEHKAAEQGAQAPTG